MVASPGATAAGGLVIGSNANELNYDLWANSFVPAGSTGYAYSDWNIPNTQTATGSYTIDGIKHDFTVTYKGHVQTGVKKDSAPTVMAAGQDGDSFAEAHITAIAGVDDPWAEAVYGSGDITAKLQLTGKSEGYAIADGFAGYSSASKVTGTNNDYTKVEGAAVGKVSLNGLGGVYVQGVNPNGVITNDVRFTKATGYAEIRSIASTYPSLSPSYGSAYSDLYTSCTIDYQGTGNVPTFVSNPSNPLNPLPAYLDGSTSLDMSATGSSNARTWGGNSPVIKTESNANSLTDISDASLASRLKTFKLDDYAFADTYILNSAWGEFAETYLRTEAQVYRTETNTANRTSAESYINGGTYEAVNRPTNGTEYSVYATIGWPGYLPGMASGAHLVSALPYSVSSNSQLHLTAGNINGAERIWTTADYSSVTIGPECTNNSNDDAGSYFSTSGYTTKCQESDTHSTTVTSYYDINWINGINGNQDQDSTPRYNSTVTFTDSPVGSATYDAPSFGDTNHDGSRFNWVEKDLDQP